MKSIDINIFDPSSVDVAIRELQRYERHIEAKTEELRRRIADAIRNAAEPVFASSIAEDNMYVVHSDGSTTPDSPVLGDVSVTVDHSGDKVSVVIASGNDAIFMEFGAGVYHNGPVGSSPNPLNAKNALGFTIGSYSGYKPDKKIWVYRGSDNVAHMTHGTPASMPLYKAVMSVWPNLVKIAEEVFNS